MLGSGKLLLGLGLFVAILGLAALANYSQRCYVNPGGFPCDIQYQVALLAPLYPLSNTLMALGVFLALVGSVLMTLGPRLTRSAERANSTVNIH